MLDGIGNSEILRVLSNHYPMVCGRILWIILIVGQTLASLPSLSQAGSFCEVSTQNVSMWPICLVLKLEKFLQALQILTMKHLFVRPLYLSTHQHIEV
jgi:hypothetical protein